MLQALAASLDNPDNSLIESISLFEGLFQRYRVVRPMLDRIASCASFNCGIPIASELSETALAASVLCCTTDILHLVAELHYEVCRLFHFVSTWIVDLISAPSRDRQQPC